MESALTAAMEYLGGPAFLLAEGGEVIEANSAGRRLLDVHRSTATATLSAVYNGDPSVGYDFVVISAPAQPRHVLAVARASSNDDLVARVAAASEAWRLTPRQREVLTLLAEGHANKSIAECLCCAAATVEIHVSAILQRARCDSRAQLIARVWRGCNR